MIKSLIGAGALAMLAGSAGLALAANCHEQLVQAGEEVASNQQAQNNAGPPYTPGGALDATKSQDPNAMPQTIPENPAAGPPYPAGEALDASKSRNPPPAQPDVSGSGSTNPPGPPYTPGGALDATKNQDQGK